MTKNEKKLIVNLLRMEIKTQQQLSVIKEMLFFYFHSGTYSEKELEECEKIAQNIELD